MITAGCKNSEGKASIENQIIALLLIVWAKQTRYNVPSTIQLHQFNWLDFFQSYFTPSVCLPYLCIWQTGVVAVSFFVLSPDF